MSDTEPKFIVFNYVTSRAEQSDVAPAYGDPNAQLQAEVSQAYAGITSGATSLSASTPATPTVSMLADPSAQLASVALSSLSISPQQLTQIQQSLNGLDAVGQLPATLSNMSAHATNVLENGTRMFEAIDLTFQPAQSDSPNRCATLGDFIGSVQGLYNDTLKTVTGSLNQITNALISIPRAIITGFATTVTGVITAIQTGVQSVIDASITTLNTVSTQLFGGLGTQIQTLISGTGEAITKVQQAIQGEIDRVAGAIADVTNNPFRLVVPNVNPCLSSVLTAANPPATTFPIDAAGRVLGGI